MYFNENSTKEFMCNTQYCIDLIIIVALRFFESQLT